MTSFVNAAEGVKNYTFVYKTHKVARPHLILISESEATSRKITSYINKNTQTNEELTTSPKYVFGMSFTHSENINKMSHGTYCIPPSSIVESLPKKPEESKNDTIFEQQISQKQMVFKPFRPTYTYFTLVHLDRIASSEKGVDDIAYALALDAKQDKERIELYYKQMVIDFVKTARTTVENAIRSEPEILKLSQEKKKTILKNWKNFYKTI